MDRPIETVQMGQDFNVCPSCGYKDGFHNMFRKDKDNERMQWLFICPSCSKVFDIGLTLPKP